MAKTVEELEKELAFYKQKFSVAEHNVALDGYLAYVKLVKQQVDFLKDFSIKSHIEGKKTETVLYDRAMDMGESLPQMISSMEKLKIELNIEYDEKDGMIKQGATSPQSIFKK